MVETISSLHTQIRAIKLGQIKEISECVSSKQNFYHIESSSFGPWNCLKNESNFF